METVGKHKAKTLEVCINHRQKFKKALIQKEKNRIQQVEDDEGDHQHQDVVGGSGLPGASVVSSGRVNMLHPLAVSEQEKHHGATGTDHEGKKHGIRDGPKVHKSCVRSYE